MMGYGWSMMALSAIVNLAFWVGMILLAVWAIRSIWRPRPREDKPLEILRRRFAAGEISAEEYERSKRTLGG